MTGAREEIRLARRIAVLEDALQEIVETLSEVQGVCPRHEVIGIASHALQLPLEAANPRPCSP